MVFLGIVFKTRLKYSKELFTTMLIIIFMKTFLDCDWLRGMQFLGNMVQKKGNWVQKRVTNVTFWLANKQRNSLPRANQMRHLNGAKSGSTPDQFRAKTAMVRRLQHIFFCNRNNCRGAEKTALKTKTLRKALVFGSLFGRIDYFRIPHNTLCLPPKFCITYCLKMLLGKCNTPRSI